MAAMWIQVDNTPRRKVTELYATQVEHQNYGMRVKSSFST